MAGVELQIASDSEILVRSSGLFRAYLGDPADGRAKMTADGWYRTGDAGFIGPDGHLRIVDRMNDIGTLSDGTPFPPKFFENRIKRSAYVREAVAFGGGRDMACVLIDLDAIAVGAWVNRQGISYTGRADLSARAEVQGLIGEVIAAVNADLAADPVFGKAQIRRFAILPEELDADDGMLTRMRKLKRAAVAERYRTLIDAMYAGAARSGFDTRSLDPHGDTATTRIDIVIADARTFSPTPDANTATAA
ncbi:MAG: long-chain fatty acid--CoA ligase [Rhodospirillales bacterium]|nr:long-chain fatty acid--CoA ligase [Rhodospirillales bacterium]